MIAAHPNDYLPADGWQEKASTELADMLPTALAKLLDEFLAVRIEEQRNTQIRQPPPAEDMRRLGF
ncbi:MAG: hypothetical protein KPEEDBHJ_01224 [Anaerolineales bacterium]|nr:hypothetical protein [Anaerolineales bacterium]